MVVWHHITNRLRSSLNPDVPRVTCGTESHPDLFMPVKSVLVKKVLSSVRIFVLYCRDLYKYEVVRQRAIDTFRRNRPNMHMITAKMVAEDLHLKEWYLVTIERYFSLRVSHIVQTSISAAAPPVQLGTSISLWEKGFKDSVQPAPVYTCRSVYLSQNSTPKYKQTFTVGPVLIQGPLLPFFVSLQSEQNWIVITAMYCTIVIYVTSISVFTPLYAIWNSLVAPTGFCKSGAVFLCFYCLCEFLVFIDVQHNKQEWRNADRGNTINQWIYMSLFTTMALLAPLLT